MLNQHLVETKLWRRAAYPTRHLRHTGITPSGSIIPEPTRYCAGKKDIGVLLGSMDGRSPSRPTCRDDFEIAIITALPLEYDAAIDVFDGFWNDDGDPYGKAEGDQNTYTTGWIGQHNVVLVICSDIGKVNATSVATSCSVSFTRVKMAFLVGVCGVAPQTSDGNEILLGDVVVGDQIVPYDLGKRYSDQLRLKNNLPCKTSESRHSLRRFMTTMQTGRYRKLLPTRVIEHLRTIQDEYVDKYKSPQPSEDKLFLPDYRHKHQTPDICQICHECIATSNPVCGLALTSTCEDLGCDDSKLVPRRRLANILSQRTPIVHWGTFGSADTVLKSSQDRDWISRQYGVIAFEMEATGACDVFPCIVVKGACDYADSHKNKKWQNYAAITAACVMKALLKWYPKTSQRTTPSDLKAQLRVASELPPRVYLHDLVTVNDALGETYGFSLSLIDSLEEILKRKFQGVGIGKIERGDWMLHNHCTGHALDLSKPWKAVVKPGQILNMSMIFRRAHTMSITCPWCNSQNEFSLDNRGIQCANCSGSYRRIEEVHDVIGVRDINPQRDVRDGGKQSLGEPKLAGPLPPKQHHDEEKDIHSYTRVQVLEITFRIKQLASLESGLRERQIVVSHRDLDDIYRLTQRLAANLQLSEEECRAAITGYYIPPVLSTTENAIHSTKMAMRSSETFGQDSSRTVFDDQEPGSGSEQYERPHSPASLEFHSDLSSSNINSDDWGPNVRVWEPYDPFALRGVGAWVITSVDSNDSAGWVVNTEACRKSFMVTFVTTVATKFAKFASYLITE